MLKAKKHLSTPFQKDNKTEPAEVLGIFQAMFMLPTIRVFMICLHLIVLQESIFSDLFVLIFPICYFQHT